MTRQTALAIALVVLGVPPGWSHAQPETSDRAKNDGAADADAVLEKAAELRQRGDLDEALEVVERLIAAQPELAAAYYERARIYSVRGDLERTERDVKRCLALEKQQFGAKDPRIVQTLSGLSWVYKSQGRFDEAEAALAEAGKIPLEANDENGVWLAYQRGNLAQDRGRYEEAEQHQRRALERAERVWPQPHESLATVLNALANALESQGRYDKATAPRKRSLAVRRKVHGKAHPLVADSLYALGFCYFRQDRYEEAIAALEPALEIELNADDTLRVWIPDVLGLSYNGIGERDKAETHVKNALEAAERFWGKASVDYASVLHDMGIVYYDQSRYQEAQSAFEGALAVRRKEFGREHVDTMWSLSQLARVYHDLARYEKSGQAWAEVYEVRKNLLGEGHVDTLWALNGLADIHKHLGRFDEAERLFMQVRDRSRAEHIEDGSMYPSSLSDLGLLYQTMGRYALAERYFRDAIEAYRESIGLKQDLAANAIASLSDVYRDLGRYAEAEAMAQRALKIREEVFGPVHFKIHASLQNLGYLYECQGKYDEAGLAYQRSLEVSTEAFGPESSHAAEDLAGLASVRAVEGRLDEAETLARRALAIQRKIQHDQSTYLCFPIQRLAFIETGLGRYDEAERLHREALGIRENVLGKEHPDVGWSLYNIAGVLIRRGDDAKALPSIQRAVQVSRRHLELTANLQSERQQLLMAQSVRQHLDRYVSISHRASQSGRETYRELLAWKGAVLARQRQLRLARGDQSLSELFAELDRTSSRLATRALNPPGGNRADQQAWKTELDQLTRRKEELEAELSERSGEFRKQQRIRSVSVDDIQAALPPKTALVDFLVYYHEGPSKLLGIWWVEQHLAAFVVRPEGEVVQLDLGPAEPIGAAVDAWRKSFGRMGGADDAAPGRELKRLVWEPLEEHLEGIDTVLVSPDGALGRFPLAALPGGEPGTYLIEERALAVVPVPQLLPDLLKSRPPQEETARQANDSLLLVGDVDFGEDDRREEASNHLAAVRAAALAAFAPLPATRGEMLAVWDSFSQRYETGRVKMLRRRQATEADFKGLAPGYRWVHIATHGFFAPPELRSALGPSKPLENRQGPACAHNALDRLGLSGFHPGLLSGLALAGANAEAIAGEGDDGILTALEVAALDLRGAELVVLSACETGLGEVAGGEGLLGLQRALQVSGARSVVASLWKVHDEATRALMERFYENLWQRNLGTLEALREAQLWMLREGGVRGLVSEDAPADKRLPPYYWAGFVLSGDPGQARAEDD